MQFHQYQVVGRAPPNRDGGAPKDLPYEALGNQWSPRQVQILVMLIEKLSSIQCYSIFVRVVFFFFSNWCKITLLFCYLTVSGLLLKCYFIVICEGISWGSLRRWRRAMVRFLLLMRYIILKNLWSFALVIFFDEFYRIDFELQKCCELSVTTHEVVLIYILNVTDEI